MILWLAAALALLASLALLAWLVPLTLSSSLQIRGEPSGNWAIALGLGLGPVSLSAIAAAGTRPFMTCHLFGKQLVRVPLSRRSGPAQKGGAEEVVKAPGSTRFSGLERAVRRSFRALDPVDTLLFWWGKERILQVRSLVLDVEYSFRDVALTGKILAGLCVLSGVLPEHYVVNQTPAWECEDRLALTVDGKFRIWPGRLFVDLLGYVLKARARARSQATNASD